MLGTLGVATTLLSAALAQGMSRFPTSAAALETACGVGLLAGLGLLGASLPYVC